jgi:peptide/nickel transport system substrate-binding protein
LDEVGYKDTNGDGLREKPDGTPLNISFPFYSPTLVHPAELVRDQLKAFVLKLLEKAA